MPSYRVFVLGEDGKVTVGQEVSCPDDAAALKKAREILAGSGKAEVWQGSRMVGVARG